MAQLDYIVQAFTLYIDGFGKAGSGEKTSLPKLKKKTEDFRGGGMLMGRKVGMGYEPMEYDATFSAFDPQILTKGGLYAGNRDFSFSARGYLDGDGGAKHTAICQMTGEVIELDPGEWDAGKKAVLKIKVALTAVTLTINGATIWDIDSENNIYNVGGDDPSAALSAALGF